MGLVERKGRLRPAVEATYNTYTQMFQGRAFYLACF